MRNFYFSGIYPLMLYAAIKNKVGDCNLHHIQSINEYFDERYSSNHETYPSIVSKIASVLELGEVTHHTFRWICPPSHIKDRVVKYIDIPDITISNGDLLSTNLLGIFSGELKNKKIILIAEGASGLDLFYGKSLVLHLLRQQPVYVYCGHYVPSLRQKFIRLIHWITYRELDSVLNTLCSSDLLFEMQYIELLKNFNYMYLPVDEIASEDYINFLRKQLTLVTEPLKSIRIVIKPHPRDVRNYIPFFSYLGVHAIQIQNPLSLIPAELFFQKFNFKYFGGLSTSILSVPKERLVFSCPLEANLKSFYKKQYYGLIKLVKIAF